ncbi:hypothetical protein lerEdw1_007046 [Lerista edwardsae]|nr:hypothetical protein lerEdw1_007046 [Lerista edwardsae]
MQEILVFTHVCNTEKQEQLLRPIGWRPVGFRGFEAKRSEWEKPGLLIREEGWQREGVESKLPGDMNFESVRNIMDDEQHHKQAKEPYEVEGRDYAVTCQTCNSNGMSQRVFPTSSYHPCMYIYNYSDWEICEELRLQELKEVKARAAQMEKTMRWWSDCTANWREKWSKVRVERNKAREEGRQLKLKLEATMKELSALKKINHGSLSENEVEAGNIWKKNFGSPESGSFWMKEYHLGPLEKTPSKYVQNNKISEVNAVFHFNIYNDGHQNEVENIVEDLEENTEASSQKNVKIWELQTEMERLQSENAAEREKRKLLETEKQELERENRRLKTQVKDLHDLLGKKSKPSAIHLCGDLKTKQSEHLEKK